MITQRMMVGGGAKAETWQFTVNTEATNPDGVLTGIPFSLYEQDSVTLNVDWGDGQTSILTSADYSVDDAMASVHEYSAPGVYQIKISSQDWESAKIGYTLTTTTVLTSNNQKCLRYFKETLVSLDSPLPEIYGSEELNSSGRTERQGNCYGIFYRCNSLNSIPPLFLSKHTNGLITSYYYTFAGCDLLTSTPQDLLYYNRYAEKLNSMLLSNNIHDIELNIISPSINSIAGFLTASTSYSRVIHVKAGTTTETTFSNNTNMGLTVIADIQ